MANRTNNSTIEATLTQGSKTVTAAGTPEQVTSTTTRVETVEFVARKTRTTANTGNVYLGVTSGAGTQTRVLAPGDTWVVGAPVGKKVNLADFYIDAATSGDGVYWTTIN